MKWNVFAGEQCLEKKLVIKKVGFLETFKFQNSKYDKV